VKRITEVDDHARMRMRARDIHIGECEEVLNDPSADMPGSRPTSRKLYGEVAGRRLVIFVEPLGGDNYLLLSCADRDVGD